VKSGDDHQKLICYPVALSGKRHYDNVRITGNPPWNVPHETLVAGKFNSPYGVVADSERNIIVAECLIGGKINKLTRSI
jgi:hypothetical protein